MKFRIEKLNEKFDETLRCDSIEQIKNDKKKFSKLFEQTFQNNFNKNKFRDNLFYLN